MSPTRSGPRWASRCRRHAHRVPGASHLQPRKGGGSAIRASGAGNRRFQSASSQLRPLRRIGVPVALTSLASRNEPGNAGLHNGIEPDPRLDSFVDLPHGVFRKGGDVKVFLDSTRSLRGGQERRPTLDRPRERDLRIPRNGQSSTNCVVASCCYDRSLPHPNVGVPN